MFRKAVPLVAGAVVLVALLGWMITLRRAPGAHEVADVRREVDQLRAASSSQSSRIAARENPTVPIAEQAARTESKVSPEVGENLQSDLERQVERVDRIEKSVAGIRNGASAGPVGQVAASVARGHQVIEMLKALSTGEDQWAIHEAVGDLVGLGEAVVPEIAGILESGFDKVYEPVPSTRGGRYYGHLRIVLMDSLRQMRNPAANRALLQGVRRAGLLADYGDMLVLCGAADDPELVAGLDELVPVALKKVAEIGWEEAERRTPCVVLLLVRWVQWHSLKETQGTIEAILLVPPSGPNWLQYSYQLLFNQLAAFSPERAVEVIRRLRATNPSDGFIADMSYGLKGTIPSVRLVEYYELLLARVPLSARAYQGVLGSIPPFPYVDSATRDFAIEVEDSKVLERFLEKRLALEANADIKAALEHKLGLLKDQIALLKDKIAKAPK